MLLRDLLNLSLALAPHMEGVNVTDASLYVAVVFVALRRIIYFCNAATQRMSMQLNNFLYLLPHRNNLLSPTTVAVLSQQTALLRPGPPHLPLFLLLPLGPELSTRRRIGLLQRCLCS